MVAGGWMFDLVEEEAAETGRWVCGEETLLLFMEGRRDYRAGRRRVG
jgi:NADH:ubiquinone oxidoreductase subunit F (NADH-binding)